MLSTNLSCIYLCSPYHQKSNIKSKRKRLFNSCEAIAVITRDIVVFYNSKNLNCIGSLCFLGLEEKYWRSPFLNNFIGVIFEAGNETHEKIWSDFGAEQKLRVERKGSGFCSCRCFWEREKLMCEKNFSKRAKFFVNVRLFKVVFLQLLMVMKFDYDFCFCISFTLVLIGLEGFK